MIRWGFAQGVLCFLGHSWDSDLGFGCVIQRDLGCRARGGGWKDRILSLCQCARCSEMVCSNNRGCFTGALCHNDVAALLQGLY